MGAQIKELERVSKIAHGKIPVSEESAVFNLFADRREMYKKLCKTMTESDVNYYPDYLNQIEEQIKIYLCL